MTAEHVQRNVYIFKDVKFSFQKRKKVKNDFKKIIKNKFKK